MMSKLYVFAQKVVSRAFPFAIFCIICHITGFAVNVLTSPLAMLWLYAEMICSVTVGILYAPALLYVMAVLWYQKHKHGLMWLETHKSEYPPLDFITVYGIVMPVLWGILVANCFGYTSNDLVMIAKADGNETVYVSDRSVSDDGAVTYGFPELEHTVMTDAGTAPAPANGSPLEVHLGVSTYDVGLLYRYDTTDSTLVPLPFVTILRNERDGITYTAPIYMELSKVQLFLMAVDFALAIVLTGGWVSDKLKQRKLRVKAPPS